MILHPKGMPDILPRDQNWWLKIGQVTSEVASIYDFSFIETPIVEHSSLFEASLGASSDVVEKQMFVLKTKGGDNLALRPEGTAGVVRAYLENRLGYYAQPLKVYYAGPMFRYEQPQAGRFRQFHQVGFEVLGDSDPFYDLQILLSVSRFFNLLKIKDFIIRINTIGCRVCRPTYRRKLQDYYSKIKGEICPDCERRLELNPLRILDCKNKKCIELKAGAPTILDYLCHSCNSHFRKVLELVENNNIIYESDPYLVRGLDYYSRTVFEFFGRESGAALASGGRYDYLSEILGWHPLAGVGAAIGVERVIEVLRAGKMEPDLKIKPKVFFIAVGEQAKKSSTVFIERLRQAGIRVGESIGRESLKGQLKTADRDRVGLVLIFGQKESFDETIIVREMATGEQETIMLNKLVEEVRKRLN